MRGSLGRLNKEHLGGMLMLVIGLAAAVQGAHYKIGTLSRMEPGFFPVALGIMLALCGIAIMVASAGTIPVQRETRWRPEWRGWICICLAIIAFIELGRYGGLIPATFAIVCLSALGDRRNSLQTAATLGAAAAAIAVIVFWWALQIQFPLFTWG